MALTSQSTHMPCHPVPQPEHQSQHHGVTSPKGSTKAGHSVQVQVSVQHEWWVWLSGLDLSAATPAPFLCLCPTTAATLQELLDKGQSTLSLKRMGALWRARTSSSYWKMTHAWWGWGAAGAPAGVGAITWPGLGEAQAQQGCHLHHPQHIQAKLSRPLWQPEWQSHIVRALLHELWLSRSWPNRSTQGAPPAGPACCCKAWAIYPGHFLHPSSCNGAGWAVAVAAAGSPPSLLRRGSELCPHTCSNRQTMGTVTVSVWGLDTHTWCPPLSSDCITIGPISIMPSTPSLHSFLKNAVPS